MTMEMYENLLQPLKTVQPGCLITQIEARDFVDKKAWVCCCSEDDRRKNKWTPVVLLDQLNCDFDNEEKILKSIFCALACFQVKKGIRKWDPLYEKIIYAKQFNNQLIDDIYKLLKVWGMNRRGMLVSQANFIKQINDLVNVYGNQCKQSKLLDFTNKNSWLMQNVNQIFTSLSLSNSKSNSQLVTTSKTLHLLFPNVFIIIDRTYTLQYFNCGKEVTIPTSILDQYNIFLNIHIALAQFYKAHQGLFDNLSHKTGYPVTKLLDYMIIGFQL